MSPTVSVAARPLLVGSGKPPTTHPLKDAAVERFGGHHPPTPSVRGSRIPRAAAPAVPRSPLRRAAVSRWPSREGSRGLDGLAAQAPTARVPREMSEAAP